ncbi:hypothetical protein HanHA300_Chr13g0481941 [Helianthus annuus]|nr:hypothetical protein HanHA300_Chr13g0481941 [Helianthus annuus]KAJ0497679.1 hypothetical protein HanHA89_Chr13g0513961 [Helianthus annuus]KAJ0663684.1 hypothetical protein HanLR1_Chr13g0483841 [Helianthus annuus]
MGSTKTLSKPDLLRPNTLSSPNKSSTTFLGLLIILRLSWLLVYPLLGLSKSIFLNFLRLLILDTDKFPSFSQSLSKGKSTLV